MEEETQEEEKEIASTTLLSAIQTKVGEQSSGRMYVEIEVRGKKIQDTGADTVYMMKKLTDEISIPYKKEKGYVKGINAKSLPIYGVAWGIDIQIGPWRGKVDITVASLDDQKFYLGMDFLDMVKAFLVPYANTLFIMDNGQAYAIPMRWEVEKERVLSALRFSKNGDCSYLARGEGPIEHVIPVTSPRSSHKGGNVLARRWDRVDVPGVMAT